MPKGILVGRGCRAVEPDDALELLTWLSPSPACCVTLMDDLGWGAARFYEAVADARERFEIRIRTLWDDETIAINADDFERAARIAQRYADRHLLN